MVFEAYNSGEFKKLLRRRQRERRKTVGCNDNNKGFAYVRFKFWYISLPSSTKQQREMTKFKVLWRTLAHARRRIFHSPPLLERHSNQSSSWIQHCTS